MNSRNRRLPGTASDCPLDIRRAFGLTVRSELPLPELSAADEGDHAPVVDVLLGEVPETLPDAVQRGVRYQVARDRFLLTVDGVARFLVEEGRRIVIQREPGAEDEELRLFLLGSALGALLHQRGDLVLHGSAIEWEGGAVIFLGFSGVGKSTLATAFRKRGHGVLTDDLCVVRPCPDGQMLVQPGVPLAKLWPDSLKQLDLSSGGLRRVRLGLEKRAVPLEEDLVATPLPVRKLYALRPHNRETLEVDLVEGPRKFAVLRNNTYRFAFLPGMAGKARHFPHVLRLAQESPVSLVRRPGGAFLLDELVAMIEADLRT